MRIGVFGRGRLGNAVAAACKEHLAWQIGRDGRPGDRPDVAIDASAGEAVLAHLNWALDSGCNLVIGATGWTIPDLAARVGSRIGVVVAPNFSLSVALLSRITRILGRYAALDARFDPYIVEHHHQKKKDAPSGTARMLADVLLEACPRKQRARMPGEGAFPADELCVAAVRAGATYSSHVVAIDAPEETLEVRHEARNAGAFGQGALSACRWVEGRRGVFTMNEVAASILDPLFSEGKP